MRRLLFVVSAIVAVGGLAVGPALGAEEQWLQYRISAQPWNYQAEYGHRQLDAVEQAPDGVAMPAFKSAGVVFAKWPAPLAPQGAVWMAFDRSPGSPAADALYIDSNCDGSLADETPVKPASGNRQFGPLKVVFKTADGPVTYNLLAMYYRRDAGHTVYVMPAGWYEGEVSVGGAKYKCMLCDTSVNGAFDDVSPDFAQCDRIKLFENGKATLHFPGQYMQVAGALYHPEVARDGACVSFEPAENVATGTVSVGEGVTKITLGGEPGLLYFDTPQGTATVPAGKYRLFSWELVRADASGADWRMSGGAAPESTAFDVAEGNTVALDLGEPVTATVQANQSNGQWSFGARLAGKMGEPVSLALANNQMPPAPSLNIANADGTYKRTYRFQYG